jgi:hypothetical protein
VRVAETQQASLEVAESVEQAKRVITGAGKMAVLGGAFLRALGRADKAVHVENDAVPRLVIMNAANPGTAEIGEGFEVVLGRQPLGLEAPHLAAGCGFAIRPIAADNGPYDRIICQPFSVVDVLAAGETAEDRLTDEARSFVADALPEPIIAEDGCSEIRETENVAQFAIGEQATVRRDASAMELELDSAVEA